MVSVNLLLYKPRFYLKPCLESIFAQSYKDFELLVIDNNSQDGTAEEVAEIMDEVKKNGTRLPEWRLIVNDKNVGFAAGHNQGIKESRGEFVFLLNQDIILEKDFIKNIVEAFGQDEKIGAIQGKLFRMKAEDERLEKTQTIDNTGLIMLKNRRIIARGQGQEDSGQFNQPEEIFGADGAAPAYRRQTLENVEIRVNQPDRSAPARFALRSMAGGSYPRSEYFDEDFFMYKEDVDLAWRLRLAGWIAAYAPNAVAWHARTAGESAKTNYVGILRERLKINKLAKYLSFKNQRLMQIKNEQSALLLKHLPWFLPKEIASWVYVILFERFTWKAIGDLFRQTPGAWRKRKLIMANKKVGSKEMGRWFK